MGEIITTHNKYSQPRRWHSVTYIQINFIVPLVIKKLDKIEQQIITALRKAQFNNIKTETEKNCKTYMLPRNLIHECRESISLSLLNKLICSVYSVVE